MNFVALLFHLGSIFFGVGFLAPVIAATLRVFAVPLPMGTDPIVIGLAVGIGLGCLAVRRRSWI
jgi:hypothetical protein